MFTFPCPILLDRCTLQVQSFLRCLYNEGTSSGHPQNQLSKPLLALDPEPLPRNTFPLKLSRQEEANKRGFKAPVNPEENELHRGVNQVLG